MHCKDIRKGCDSSDRREVFQPSATNDLRFISSALSHVHGIAFIRIGMQHGIREVIMNANVARNIFAIAVFLFTNAGHADKDRNKLVEASSYYMERSAEERTWITPNSRTVDYPPDGVSLGQGWDSLRDGKVQGRCIEFGVEQAGGQVARVQTIRIFDSDSLRRSINLSYSASASANFSVGADASASVKSSFVSTSEVSSQFLSLLVKGEIQNGVAFVSAAATA